MSDLACLMCGSESSGCAEYSAINSSVILCWKCCEIAANTYWMKHSGEWLTWPSDIARKENPRKNLPASLKKLVLERDLYRCVVCNSHINLQIDHIHPVSKGGGNEVGNLQTLCAVCNNRKSNKIEVINNE